MGYLPRDNLSSLTINEIKAYLFSKEKLSARELDILKSDRRKGVQKLLSSFLKQRKKARNEEEYLHKLMAKERLLHERGYELIAGVDEAGRGPLAGPVVAAAVILDPGENCWAGINDSKQLTPQVREELYEIVVKNAKAVATAVADVSLIDEINIYHASLRAMRLAVEKLMPQPDYVLFDGFNVPEVYIPQEAVIGGDARCLSIAAASIVAKVTRDKIMLEYDREYPGYGFDRNKGYPTAEHREAIKTLGLSPIHRRTFQCYKDR
ncbi:MAG TPA: ribonuclease HII [Firmicutes bacterium]|nr:ribonuclease HII [Bacillota bacterium]